MKEITNNIYQKAINKAIDYINSNIESVDLKTLAGIVNISEYHFHRIFRAYIGESLGSYTTRLKLESAAQKLQVTNDSLKQIADKTGYQSQYSLSKAFKKHFGITPSAFRNLDTFFSKKHKKPQSEFSNLTPEILEISDINLVYIRIIAQYGSKKEYDDAWNKLIKFARDKNILNHLTEFIGLSFDDPSITRPDKCRFYACITTTNPIEPDGEFGIKTIKKGKYAVFTLKGKYSGLNDLYEAIYYKWLLNTEYKLVDSLAFEKYINNPKDVSDSQLLTEIYIPIANK